MKAYNYFFLALIVAILSQCKQKEFCGSMNEPSADGIVIDQAFCTETAYVLADRPFDVSYVPSAGNDQDYIYNYTAPAGFTLVDGSEQQNTQFMRAGVNTNGEICLTIENLCGDLADEVCRNVEIINTPYIYYVVGNYGDLNNNDNANIPGPVNTHNFSGRQPYVYNDKIYCILGSSPLQLYEYSPQSERWTKIQDLSVTSPLDITNMNVITEGNTAYIFGQNSIYHMNLTDNTLSKAMDYPNSENNGSVFATRFDNDYYFATANDPSDLQDSIRLYKYDPVNKSAERKANYPSDVYPGTFARQVSSQILVGGGTTDNVFTTVGSLYEYTPTLDKWEVSTIANPGVSVFNYKYKDTIYIVTEKSEMYFLDEFAKEFKPVDLTVDSWPTCYTPKLDLYNATPGSVWGTVVGDNLHLQLSWDNRQGAALVPTNNSSAVLRLEAL